MARIRWDRPDAFDHVLLIAAGDPRLRAAILERMRRVPGRDQTGRARGRYPRYRVFAASTPAAVRKRCNGTVSIVAVDLAMRGGNSLDLVRRLRDEHPELPILAYARGAPASEAIAAAMAGADFFHDCADASCAGVERAVEHALDRRRLIALIERGESQLEDARGKLAQLSGELVRAVPGFRPLHDRSDVLPFREAARRYLLAAAQLFEADPRGLASALGVSYFALRRLLARYDVPYPSVRSRK